MAREAHSLANLCLRQVWVPEGHLVCGMLPSLAVRRHYLYCPQLLKSRVVVRVQMGEREPGKGPQGRGLF